MSRFWLAENLKGVAAVICDPDRAAAGHWAIEHLDSNVLVLDDGFQHLQLARDLNILAIDATNPWGGGHCFLLEGYAKRREARHVQIAPSLRAPNQIPTLKYSRPHFNRLIGDRPIFTSHMQTKGVRELGDSRLDPGIGIASTCRRILCCRQSRLFFPTPIESRADARSYAQLFPITINTNKRYHSPCGRS